MLSTANKIKHFFKEFEKDEISISNLDILKESVINYIRTQGFEGDKENIKKILRCNAYRKIKYLLWKTFREKTFYKDLKGICLDFWDRYFIDKSWQKAKKSLIAAVLEERS